MSAITGNYTFVECMRPVETTLKLSIVCEEIKLSLSQIITMHPTTLTKLEIGNIFVSKCGLIWLYVHIILCIFKKNIHLHWFLFFRQLWHCDKRDWGHVHQRWRGTNHSSSPYMEKRYNRTPFLHHGYKCGVTSELLSNTAIGSV